MPSCLPPLPAQPLPPPGRSALALLAALWLPAALAAPPNETMGFFASEWWGSGHEGSLCQVLLNENGSGTVQIASPGGRWQVADIRWRNRRQNLLIEAQVPRPENTRKRISPLPGFRLSSTPQDTLELIWGTGESRCTLLRAEQFDRRIREGRLLP